ncbi:tRNA guanosine(34) transglycosylase Tgt [Candidatus Saccharibacteria bacterium]|nr:tRNA guanosine(34) transglycosylase Tgt [Candidatus Saccharibacteria bacterium]
MKESATYKSLSFTIDKTLKSGLGRIGSIKTAHDEIKTPAFMTVGTKGEVRFVDMDSLHQIGAEAMLSNGYHLRKLAPEIAKQGGLAKYSGWNGPTLTDSGGFQVMSLGSGLGKVVSMDRKIKQTSEKNRLAHVSDEGVDFTDPFTGEQEFIGPEESMQIQTNIGADIHMAFDELTSLADNYDYNVQAMFRTEMWAERSLKKHQEIRDSLGYRQNLYGVLQGGRWEDLRRRTAKVLGTMDFDGYGLGGAFLKEQLGDILRWCNEELPFEKPKHLLGLSRPDDIFIGFENGADTLDCVAPTREARHGRIYTRDGEIYLRKFKDCPELLDENCDCPTCRSGWTKGQLRALWKSPTLEEKALYYKLSSIHNLRFTIRIFEEIRQNVLKNSYEAYKTDFLSRYYSQKKSSMLK